MAVQEKNNYCLCSVICDILSKYDIIKSQEDVAKNLTPAKHGFRADNLKIKNFMGDLGFDYNFYWWNKTPFNEPDSLLKEICNHNGFIGIGKHVYRVLEFEDPNIVVLNPANEYSMDFSYSYLMSQLKKHDGGFGLVKKLK